MDPAVCLANARLFDPNATLCPDARCNSGGTSKYLDARCHCAPPYTQNPCPFSADSPVWIDNLTPNGCYCCCSCFAYGTPVAYAPQAFKPIEQYVVGDTVLAATRDLRWEPRAVEFSGGVKPNAENGKTVVTIYYDLGTEKRSLVVTPDHVFFLATKELKRASDLEPGTDQLVNAETGAPVAILGKETGGWWKGLHHIATTADASTNVDYHLLNSNGVVTGDWALQVAKLPETATGNGAKWKSTAPTGRAAFHRLMPGFDPTPLRHDGFAPFSVDPMRVPPYAQSFFRPEQADELLRSGHILPIGAIGIQEPLFFVFRQLHYYYTNVFYDLVWEEEVPNIYSFVEHGVKFVVITGGMARLDCMNISGLYVALASATGRLVGGPPLVPKSPYELSCLGQGDYFAMLAVLRNILFMTDYRAQTFAGLEMLRTLFGYIEHKGGLPGNQCNLISLNCRLKAFEAGRGMQALPWCAGGPRTDFLSVKKTTVTQDCDATKVTIQFDQALNAESACEPQNYGIKPGAPVDGVTMLLGSQDAVVVTTRLDPLVDYVLTMSNIISAEGDIFEHDRAEVKLRRPEQESSVK